MGTELNFLWRIYTSRGSSDWVVVGAYYGRIIITLGLKELRSLKNEILNNYIISIYPTLLLQVILGKLIVKMIVMEVINENIIYFYSKITSIELKMIF